MSERISEKEKKPIFQKFLDFVEKAGNKLPNPITLFLILALAAIVISHICQVLGVSAVYDVTQKNDAGAIEIISKEAKAVSLLNAEGIRFVFSSMVKNFTGFAPLGTVLVAMLGVGTAEATGFISAVLKRTVLITPKRFITLMLVFLGVMSNIASDVGYVVLIPLGAVIFLSLGRHPLAGIAAVFAGVSGGFSANLLVGVIDPLLGGISTQAANIVSQGYEVQPTANWYFLMASTILITVIGTVITEKVVEPRLGKYTGINNEVHNEKLEEITGEEKAGLKAALISLVVYCIIIGIMAVPANGILRNPETKQLMVKSAFVDGLVPIIAFAFFIPGLVYGIVAKTVKSDNDVAKFMGNAMSSMGSFLALIFVAAQFVAYFTHSNLGIILAVKGADFLEGAGIKGIPLIVGFVLISAFINLFMGSASAKWAIMAPIFIPMFMRLGYSPELTQLAYRIGDSSTNIITPLMYYFAAVVAFAKQYDEDIKIGTLISMMLPYSMLFLLGWTLLLIIWMMFGLPIGPGASLFFN
ncbi:MAG: AbgT family transporter [Leptotrichiaceae bacterium]|nr:AbgT family transporter [Leptotrichiaceae bacterium]